MFLLFPNGFVKLEMIPNGVFLWFMWHLITATSLVVLLEPTKEKGEKKCFLALPLQIYLPGWIHHTPLISISFSRVNGGGPQKPGRVQRCPVR